MKRKWITILGIVFLAAQVGAEEAPALKTPKEKKSYGIGVDTARNFQHLGLDLDWDMLMKAMRDVSSGAKLLMTEEDLRAAKASYQVELREKQAAVAKKAAEENKKAGIAFLEGNKGKEGVVTLPSGLQYKILKAGSGKTPTDSDTVEVHFRGTLLDGTEFENSYSREQPAKFTLRRGIIDGWREALKLMPEGSKWQLFIPPKLAYGEKGTGRYVGPNATLVYELELVDVK
ncbi:MAG: FKBP-type peptidyl-prolyl cis-trans isomerase [Deltaproteobacteria bacterium]|nr:FKBP-type peptidyl-prolyl cis-trans isomerase [Deltaproteobacteria bacterium]